MQNIQDWEDHYIIPKRAKAPSHEKNMRNEMLGKSEALVIKKGNGFLFNNRIQKGLKRAGVTNKKGPKPTAAMYADAEEGKVDLDIQYVDHEFKIALMKARVAKGLKQSELAPKINCKVTVIQDYEAGKAVPDNSIIQALERVLQCKLPRQKKKK